MTVNRVAAVVVAVAITGAVAACSGHSTGTATARSTPNVTSPAPTASASPAPPSPPSPGPSLSGGPLPGAPLPGLAPPSGITPPAAPTLSLPTETPPTRLSKVVLGPNGFGALRLGMIPAQARATHLVGPASTAPGQTCATARLLAAPSGGTGPSVFYSPTLGLAAIYAYPGITTPAGIAIGATLAQLRQAYPTWRGIQGDAGPGYVTASGSGAAQYRIAVSNGHVVEIAIQLDNQDCYE